MRWHAARGAGALRDGRRLEVSRIRELREATLFHGNLGPGEAGPAGGIWRLIGQVDRTRGFGDEHVLIEIDRKSTRLNSSHLVISYAVFCLKKKKETKDHTDDWLYYNSRGWKVQRLTGAY